MLTDQPGLSSSLGREGLALVGSKETGRQKRDGHSVGRAPEKAGEDEKDAGAGPGEGPAEEWVWG